MSAETAFDLVVVGAGPAGCAAAVQAHRLGVGVRLLDRRGAAGGLVENAWRIENHPGLSQPVGGAEYVRRLRSMLDRFGVSVARFDVASLESDGGEVVLQGTGGKVIRAPAAVLATGTRSRKAGFFGEESGLVYTEVRLLMEGRPGRYAVVGGGEAAMDYALSLASIGCDVVVLVRSDEPGAYGRLPRLVEASGNIRLMRRTVVTEVCEDPGGGVVAGIRCDGCRRTLDLDGVVVAVGREPMLPDLPRHAAVTGRGAVDGLPGVFCAGDVALGGLGQACSAAGDGLVAAGMACGYIRSVRCESVRRRCAGDRQQQR